MPAINALAVDRTTTDQTTQKLINDNLNAMVDTIGGLRDRWQDEKEYENIADYFKIINDCLKKLIPSADDVKAGKWFVSFRLPNNRSYRYFIKFNQAGWERIK